MRDETAAPVNKIIPLSTVDGPGARSAIFVQACNIACRFCHNPETQRLCIDCGDCVPGCPTGALHRAGRRVVWQKSRCVECDQCIQICRHFASPRIERLSAADVRARLLPNRPFIRGITVSGGEATLYPDFLLALFRLAKADGLSTLIDFNGCRDISNEPFLDVTDGAMIDLKAWSAESFRAVTPIGSNTHLKTNLKVLHERGKLAEIRLVVIEPEVDVENCLRGVAELIPRALAETPLKLITFRHHGVRGEMRTRSSPTKERMEAIGAMAASLGFKQIVIR